MGSDPELEAIQKRKLQELRRQLAEEQQRGERQQVLESQKKALLRQILTTDARQRLGRIRLVKPSFAEQLELQLIQAAQTGRMRLPITDQQLKTILENLQTPRREIKFRRR